MRWSRWRRLLAPHAGALGLAGALLAVAAAVPAATVWWLHEAVERLSGDDPGAVGPVAFGFVASTVALGGSQLLRTAVTRRVSGAVASQLRLELHAAFLAADEGELGDRLHALLDEVDQVQYGVSALVTALRNPMSAALVLGSAAALCPPLVPWAVALLAPVAPVSWWAGSRVRAAARAHRERRAELSALMAEQLGNVELVRAFGAEPDETRRLARRDDAEREARLALEVGRLLPSALVQIVAAVALAGLVVVGASLVRDGATDVAAVLAFVGALLVASRPLAGLSEAASLWQRASVALERVDRALVAATGAAGVAGAEVGAPAVEVRWLGAAVVRDGRRVLRGVTATARVGELTALVGPTGSGKTTLLRLAAGAVPPDHGQVWIGDRPAISARGAVAVVPQHPACFSRTVAENVALGHERPDRDEVVRCLTLAGARDLDPDRVCVDAGRTLSGGERQRLGVARALYRGAPILLLDEPTASLDATTATALVDVLMALRPGRTVVVATHDARVFGRADRIVRLRDGAIDGAGEGTWIASPHS